MTLGPKQAWDPEQYARNARFVAVLALPVVALLAPQPGERIVDLGCGDGELTAQITALGCRVVGVDASAEMVAAACARGLDARQLDAEELQLSEELAGWCDAVFTNAVLHWVRDPARALEGVRRALRPGGRFVGEFGGEGNVATIRTALDEALARRGLSVPSPWYLPAPEAFGALLEEAGFAVTHLERIERPTLLPGDVSGWLETFGGPYTAALPESERPALLAELVETLRPALCDAEGRWWADYVRIRFAAERR